VIPDVDIDYETLSAEMFGKITLNCLVKSLTTVEMTWMFNGKVLAKKSSELVKEVRNDSMISNFDSPIGKVQISR
jgi:hypothetical protein